VVLILAALIEAYDSAADAFRCYYTGALLNTDSPQNSFFLAVIDKHTIPANEKR